MRLSHGVIVMGVVGTVIVSGGPLFGDEMTSPTETRETFQVAQAPVASPAELALISLDFKEADIQTVLQALARKAKINIVAGKEIAGLVTIHLDNVTWEQALDTISKTYGFGYEKDGNVILVSTLEELKARREKLKALVEIESIVTKVIQLRYLDASDVKKFLEPQLTAQGKISILEMTGQKGWGFGIGQVGGGGGGGGGGSSASENYRARTSREKARSKSIVITDTPTTIDRLDKILAKIDVLPKQILIEARAMEVSRDLLRDINLGAVTGATAGSSALAVRNQPAEKNAVIGTNQTGNTVAEFASTLIPSNFTPSIFVPSTTGLTAAVAGANFFYQKLNGTQFSALLQLLEEDVRTNTLSAPHVLTISGQEARVLVGEKYPILQTQVSGTSTTTTTTTLDYYQNIGIELYVVPQVSGDSNIDMIIHPVVSARVSTVGANAYPVLNVREAETQVVMQNGDTIAIGGLLKDVKSKSRIGMPFLGKLPLIGPLFARTTEDVAKIDLLIFITARIIEPGTLSPDQMDRLQRQYEEFWKHQVRGKEQPVRQRPVSRPAEPPETAEPQQSNRGILYRKD